jgi:hypothetical protein
VLKLRHTRNRNLTKRKGIREIKNKNGKEIRKEIKETQIN